MTRIDKFYDSLRFNRSDMKRIIEAQGKGIFTTYTLTTMTVMNSRRDPNVCLWCGNRQSINHDCESKPDYNCWFTFGEEGEGVAFVKVSRYGMQRGKEQGLQDDALDSDAHKLFDEESEPSTSGAAHQILDEIKDGDEISVAQNMLDEMPVPIFIIEMAEAAKIVELDHVQDKRIGTVHNLFDEMSEPIIEPISSSKQHQVTFSQAYDIDYNDFVTNCRFLQADVRGYEPILQLANEVNEAINAHCDYDMSKLVLLYSLTLKNNSSVEDMQNGWQLHISYKEIHSWGILNMRLIFSDGLYLHYNRWDEHVLILALFLTLEDKGDLERVGMRSIELWNILNVGLKWRGRLDTTNWPLTLLYHTSCYMLNTTFRYDLGLVIKRNTNIVILHLTSLSFASVKDRGKDFLGGILHSEGMRNDSGVALWSICTEKCVGSCDILMSAMCSYFISDLGSHNFWVHLETTRSLHRIKTDRRIFDPGRLNAIASLQLLESLVMVGCTLVDDVGLQSLGNGCPSLKAVDTSRCDGITSAGLCSIVRGHPGLFQLNASHCIIDITSDLLQELKRLKHVTCFRVDGARVSHSTFQVLSTKCRSLIELGLSKCIGLKDVDIVRVVNGCTNLKALNLSCCDAINDAAITKYCLKLSSNCALLEELDLTDCYGINDAALGCFAKSCHRTYHAPCAFEVAECRWDTEDFLMLCPSHASQKFPSERSRKSAPKKPSSVKIHDEQKKKELCEPDSWTTSPTGTQNWVLCASSLSTDQKSMLVKFANLCSATVTKNWTPEVTHVIAVTDANGACSRVMSSATKAIAHNNENHWDVTFVFDPGGQFTRLVLGAMVTNPQLGMCDVLVELSLVFDP